MRVAKFISYNLSTEEINSITIVETLLVELEEYHINEFLGYDSDRFLNILQKILDNDGAEIE